MDTGLGNKAYSIIGQGRIGTILEQKPEETRIMLEEAAGVTKYRRKVEATQRKIELTEANLERVEDIQAEVHKQMRSLKRQAAKARRYKKICEEIRNLELVLYANSYHQLKEESGNKLKSTDELLQQEMAKSANLSQIHARVEAMNLELEERDSGLSDLRKNHIHFKDRVNRREAEIEALAREIRMQEELEDRLKEEQEEIKKRIVALEGEKASLREKMEKMKLSSLDREGEISLKEKRLKARQDFLEGIKEEYEKARTELNEGANKDVGLNHESGYLNKMLDQITDSRSRLEKELKDAEAGSERIINASERRNRAREATHERLLEIQSSIKHLNASSENLEQAKNRVESDLRSAEADLNVHESRLVSLQALTENYEGYKMGVRTIMKAKDLEPRRQGRILGLVADVMQVEPRYEQAVEAVLGDKLQYVIVKHQDDAKQAVDYLKKKARGRSSFVPFTDLRGNGTDQEEGNQFPLLRDFVSVPDEYNSLVDVLFGNTVLVEDLEQALSVWKNPGSASRRNGKDLSFVTMDGDMVDQRGIITGGKLTETSRGLLARKREMAELEEKSAGFRKKVEHLKNELENIITQIGGKKAELEELIEEKWSCQEELNDFDKVLFRLGQELDQLEKLAGKISGDLEKKEIDERKHKRELSRIKDELQRREVKRQAEKDFFWKKEMELKESEDEFDQLREELAKLKTELSIHEETQRGLRREMEMKDEYAEDSLKRLEKIGEDISTGQTRRDDCETRKDALKEQMKGFYGELEEAEELVNRAERERQEFQAGIREEESRAEQVREEIESLREIINRAKMEQSEIHFKMNNLVDMAREKSNLNLKDVYMEYLAEDFSHADAEGRLEHQKILRERLGEVNLTAIKEHEALKERYEFIKTQREDLTRSIESLRIAINKINRTSLEKFRKAFDEVDKKLKVIFPILFNGGTAGLKLTDETRPLESGVLVEVQPPGKKLSHMGLLSGGEKALVAMALLFAIYMIRPSPFCLLDEVDAPLDEANIDRFNDLLQEIKRASQIIMVTHNRRTMEITDRLYGVTMEEAGVSKTVTVDLQRFRVEDHGGLSAGQPALN